jgi:hypothetical protein
MTVDPLPSGEQASELILHRPRSMAAGAVRRIHIYLDNQQIGDLEHGGTVRVPTQAGPHILRARCMPLIGAQLTFILGARETLKVLIYVGALEGVQIEIASEHELS